jgi:carbon-monoxide dehydrogenase large subunit
MAAYRAIGQSAPRADGQEKVTGTARYTADVRLPGLLWAKALRSPLPHARILRIEATRAQRLPGVHAVLTGADVAGVLYGRRLRDIPVLAQDRVRFLGERVAAVAAEDLDTAQEALSLIEVEYAELPAVFDPFAALQEGAPLLHPDVNSYAGLPKPLAKPSNAFVRDTWGKGDVGDAFAQADLVFENVFTTQRVHQAYLEPHSCVVWIDPQGRVQIWASNKAPHRLKHDVAVALAISPERIRVHYSTIGADFGGKGSPMDVPLCYFLALRTGRPVKMVMDYAEEFSAGNPRHPSVVRMKTGVKRDGTLVAHQAELVFNSGAYGGFKPVAEVNLSGAPHAAGPYKVSHVHIEAVQVYTNSVPGGWMRGVGGVQSLFALESHMDVIGRGLGMDPLYFRRKNLVEEGDELLPGRRYQEMKVGETLEAAVVASEYRSRKGPQVGRGIAIGYDAQGVGQSSAAVTLNLDGAVILHTSVFEQGTGSYTVLRQIVAEELGCPVERVRVEVWDTDATPFDTGVGASRVTRVAGLAAYQAARETRRELLRLAAELLGWPEERLQLSGEEIVRDDSKERRRWADLLARVGHPVTTRVTNPETQESPVASFIAQVAEVAVDPETGAVKLLRFTTAHDVGRVLNPVGHQGQINGGLVQGIGYALTEDLGVEDGRVGVAHFGEYKIPTIRDTPRLTTVLVQAQQGVGPYQTKGIGDNAINPVAAAIANAVEDAVGVRIRDLPITAEKVHRALRRRKKEQATAAMQNTLTVSD